MTASKRRRREVHGLWTRQLIAEYDYVNYAYGLKLVRPLIEITTAQSYWGRYDPKTRTLRLTERLIQTHPWDVAVGVLKHEMAHQLVFERLGPVKAHGQTFQNICREMGLPPQMADPSGPLPEAMVHPDGLAVDEPTRKLMDRVRKLLALAESPNEHEAAQAMRAVNRIMAEHNLERLDHDASEYTRHTIFLNRKRVETRHRVICGILQEFFFVDVVLSDQYDPQNLDTFKTIELLGRPENVAMAKYVHHFLEDRAEHLWKTKGRPQGAAGRRGKKSYQLGLLAGFRQKLAEQDQQRRQGPRSTSALVLAKDAGLAQYKRRLYPRLTHARVNSSLVDPDAYHHGQKEGRDLTLHRPVTTNDGNQGRLIGGRKQKGRS
jgi:hypothetical protein